MFLKIYDLSKDTISPVVYINEIQDASGMNNMTSMSIVKDEDSSHRIYVGTNSGAIYTYLLEMQDLNGQTDSFYFVEQIKINADFESSRKDISRPVVSLHYSSLLEVLFVSHYNGNTEDNKEALSASGRATRAQKKDSTTFPDIYFGKPHVQSNGTVIIDNPSVIEIKKTLSSSKYGYATHFRDVGIIDHYG